MANSKRKCAHCGAYQKSHTMYISIKNQAFCNHDHFVEYAVIHRKGLSKKGDTIRQKEDSKRHRERKESIKTISQLKAEAQNVFNRYIRLSDPFTDCPSCDRSPEEIQANDGWKTGGCWDAGHFHSRGARPDLRFTEDNVWRQCKSCNAGSGKYSAKNQTVQNRYREKLIERIGIERVEKLDVDLGPHKWTKEELREIIATYKAKCKELNKGQ